MRRKAFTLLELLTVISIIAILLAIMLPALNKAREIAGRTICATNLKNMWTATNMYAADWNDKVSLRHPKYDNPQRYDNKENKKWYRRLYYYIPQKEIFTCPAFTEYERKMADNVLEKFTDDTGYSGAKNSNFITYSMNEYIATSAQYPDISKQEQYKLSRLQKYAAANSWMGIFIGDGIFPLDNWGDRSPLRLPIEQSRQIGRASYRHNNKSMFLTTDGRVGFFSEASALALPRSGVREITPSMLK